MNMSTYGWHYDINMHTLMQNILRCIGRTVTARRSTNWRPSRPFPAAYKVGPDYALVHAPCTVHAAGGDRGVEILCATLHRELAMKWLGDGGISEGRVATEPA